MKILDEKIPEEIYKEIYERVPVICVEAMAVDEEGNFLLIKRASEPMKDQWWFPGGRLFKFEKLADGSLRSLKQETGLEGEIEKFLGYHDCIVPVGHFPGISCHTPVMQFLVRVKGVKPEPKLDKTSSEFMWTNKVDDEWHEHLKHFLKLAGY